MPDIKGLPRGAIIGMVDIVGVVRESSSEWFAGPFGFVLENPRALPEPIPCKGALRFWDVPLDIERWIERQLPVQRPQEVPRDSSPFEEVRPRRITSAA
jgi:hypothetical protein